MGTRQMGLFLVGAQVKTAPLTMHLLLVFMVGTCAAMSVRKSPYVYQSNPMARMSLQARHHSGGNGWTSRSKNPFSYMVGNEFFCASYNSPMEMTNRRNEIWVQADEEDSANVSSVVHELLHEELPEHPHPHQK